MKTTWYILVVAKQILPSRCHQGSITVLKCLLARVPRAPLVWPHWLSDWCKHFSSPNIFCLALWWPWICNNMIFKHPELYWHEYCIRCFLAVVSSAWPCTTVCLSHVMTCKENEMDIGHVSCKEKSQKTLDCRQWVWRPVFDLPKMQKHNSLLCFSFDKSWSRFSAALLGSKYLKPINVAERIIACHKHQQPSNQQKEYFDRQIIEPQTVLIHYVLATWSKKDPQIHSCQSVWVLIEHSVIRQTTDRL